MTEFERTVLEVLGRAKEPLGWYQIERRLSTRTLRERPNLLHVLTQLEEKGLVRRVEPRVVPMDRHELMPHGRRETGARSPQRDTKQLEKARWTTSTDPE
ncbi:MAG: hypothetical protein AB7S26_37865 [Sandaracinaceae bacterium]